jgi:hypothetical protein
MKNYMPSAVRNEIMNMEPQAVNTKKGRKNIELYAGIGLALFFVALRITLNHFGLIKNY